MTPQRGLLSGILDIPDEPPRQWRGIASAAVGGLVGVVVGVVFARTFAVGGFPHSRVLLGLCVPVPAAIVTWLLSGPHRLRTAVSAAVMVVGVACLPIAGAGATPSPARLSATVDALHLPGVTTHEVRLGNGRCRPACSEIRRVSVAKGISFAKAVAELQGPLRARNFVVRQFAHRTGAPTIITAENDKLSISFEVRAVALDDTRIAGTFIAKGPAPAHSVG